MPNNGIDNPHTLLLSYGKVVYWRDGAACGKDDEWNVAVVSAKQFNSPELRFDRSGESEMNKLLTVMQYAYEAGMRAKAKQFREVLMIPETR